MSNAMPDYEMHQEHRRGAVQTVGSMTRVVVSLDLPDESVFLAEIRVVARVQGGADTAVYFRRVHVERQSGTSVLVATLDTSESRDDSGIACFVSVDDVTDTLDVDVKSIAGMTVDWEGWIDARFSV